MKRIFALIFSVLLASSALAGTVQLDSDRDGKIDVDRLPTINFRQDGDPVNATDGQLWYNNATHQIKVRDGGMVYFYNATGSEEFDDGITDGFVGAIGASIDAASMLAVDTAATQVFVANATGQISYIHALLSYTSTDDIFNAAIYTQDGSTKLAESDLTTAAASGFTTFELDTPYNVTSGTSYLLVVSSKTDGSWEVPCREKEGDEPSMYIRAACDTEDTMPSSISLTGGTTYGRTMLAHANNSATPTPSE